MFGCLPSALYEEDVELLQMVQIVDRATPDQHQGDTGGEW